MLFPIYEEKVKDGKQVYKVRLVANDKKHKPNEPVHSPTPRREELLVLLHLASSNAWAVVHMNEQRAFLSAAYKGSKPVYTRLHKGTDWFRVVGRSTASRHLRGSTYTWQRSRAG